MKRISFIAAVLICMLAGYAGQKGSAVVPDDREIVFLAAVKKGDLAAVEKMLASNPKLVMAKGDYGLYPLQRAIANGHKDVVELLIAKGADVNRCNNWANDRETSLHWAALYGEKEIAELLIAKGADVNAGNLYKETPLLWAIDAEHLDVAELLLARGADVNARNSNDFTALHRALWADHKSADKSARLLIAKGADVRAKDSLGRTPLHWAALHGQKEIAELLIAKGAEVNDQDTYGNTPLYYAAYAGFKDIAELLVAKGADRNIRNKEGRGPAGIEQQAIRSTKPFEVKQPQDLINYLVPLPKEIKITKLVQAPVEKIRITTEGDIPELDKYAVETLSEFFVRQCGRKAPLDSFSFFGFKVKLIICDKNGLIAGRKKIPGAERLAQLPNSDQSYLIKPEGRRSISIVALTGQGLYNGVNTLKQLLAPGVKKEGDKAVISFPLVDVLDWPDMPYRGFWSHGYHEPELLWLSERKCNLYESQAPITALTDMGITKEGKGYLRLNREALEFSSEHGINFVPAIDHQELLPCIGDWAFSGMKDIYKRYPDLLGKRDPATAHKAADEIAPCASNPFYVELLRDWFLDMASYPQVKDICIWPTEGWYMVCRCEQCRKVGFWTPETRAMVAAWRQVHEKHPEKRLWIQIANSITDEQVADIVRQIPKDLNIGIQEYRYVLHREPVIWPALKEFVAQGGLLSITHQLPSNYSVIDFERPGFVRSRMQEFIDEKLWGHYAYTGLAYLSLYEFNMEAAAEWSWNVQGRSEKDFAFSYAVRRGIPDPESYAAWVVKMETITEKMRPWYSMKFQPWYSWETVIQPLEKMQYGVGTLNDFHSEQDILKELDACQECRKLAAKLGGREYLYKVLMVEGPLKMFKVALDVHTSITGGTKITEAEVRERIRKARDETVEAVRNECELKSPYYNEGNSFMKRKKVLTEDIERIADGLTKALTAKLKDFAPFLGMEERTPKEYTRVGVLMSAWGAKSIMSALGRQQAEEKISVRPVAEISPDVLGSCYVLILPQPAVALTGAQVEAIRAWVEKGGGILLTHDAVGFRSHPAIFPEMGKGKERQAEKAFMLAGDTVSYRKDMAGREFQHAYYDRITLEKGKEGKETAVGKKGETLAVCGPFGKGRVVLIGMVIGQESDIKETEPKDGELELLLGGLRYLKGSKISSIFSGTLTNFGEVVYENDFEKEAHGWSTDRENGHLQATDRAHSGKYSLKIEKKKDEKFRGKDGRKLAGNEGSWFTSIKVEPNSFYVMKYHLNTELPAGEAGLYVHWLKQGTDWASRVEQQEVFNRTKGSTDGWKEMTVSVKTGEKTEQFFIELRTTDMAGVVWLDDFGLLKIPHTDL